MKIDWSKLPEHLKENETIKQFVLDHGFQTSNRPFSERDDYMRENMPNMPCIETLDSSNFLCGLDDVELALKSVFGE